jgi:hypothetical protein
VAQPGQKLDFPLFQITKAQALWDGKCVRISIEVTGLSNLWSMELDAKVGRLDGPLVPAYFTMPPELQGPVEAASREVAKETIRNFVTAAGAGPNQLQTIKPANYFLRLPLDYLDEPPIPVAIGAIDAGSEVLILDPTFAEHPKLAGLKFAVQLEGKDLEIVEIGCFEPEEGADDLPIGGAIKGIFKNLIERHGDALDTFRLEVARATGVRLDGLPYDRGAVRKPPTRSSDVATANYTLDLPAEYLEKEGAGE